MKESFLNHSKRFLLLAITMLILDIIWIVFVVGPVYQSVFNKMVQLSIAPAVAFYVLFNLGLYYFVLLKNQPLATVRIRLEAALFGVCIYGGYALTLLAVFAFYLPEVALLEIFWGPVVSFLSVQVVLWYDRMCGDCLTL